MKKTSSETLNTARFLKTTALACLLLSTAFSDSYASRTTTTDDPNQGKTTTTTTTTTITVPTDAEKETPYLLSQLQNPILSLQTLFDFLPEEVSSHIARMSFSLPDASYSDKGPADSIKSFLSLCIASPSWAGKASEATARRLLSQEEATLEKLQTYALNILTCMNKEKLETKEEIDLFLAILEASPALFTKANYENVVYIIKACMKLSPEQIKAIAAATSLLYVGERYEFLHYIIKECVPLTPEQIEERSQAIAAVASSLFTNEMTEFCHASIIEVCLKLSPEQIEDRSKKMITEEAYKLFRDSFPFPKDDMNQTRIIEACLTLTLDQIQERLKAIREESSAFFSDAMGEEGEPANTFFACFALTPEQIKAVAEAAPILFNCKMHEWGRSNIISSCQNLTPEQIKDRSKMIAEAAIAICTTNPDWGGDIISACLMLSSKQIKALERAFQQERYERGDYRFHIAKSCSVLNLTPEQIEARLKAISEEVLDLFSEKMVFDFRILIPEIIEDCLELNPIQIKERSQAIKALFTMEMLMLIGIDLIKDLLKLTPKQIAQKAASLKE